VRTSSPSIVICPAVGLGSGLYWPAAAAWSWRYPEPADDGEELALGDIDGRHSRRTRSAPGPPSKAFGPPCAKCDHAGAAVITLGLSQPAYLPPARCGRGRSPASLHILGRMAVSPQATTQSGGTLCMQARPQIDIGCALKDANDVGFSAGPWPLYTAVETARPQGRACRVSSPSSGPPDA